MDRPEPLKSCERLVWSPGTGTDLWELFCAAVCGDLQSANRLLGKDPSLARATYEYRSALLFAVRENQLGVAALLLEKGADPVGFGIPDTLIQMARDRGLVRMEQMLTAAIAGPNGGIMTRAIAAAIRKRDRAQVRGLLDALPALIHARDERTNQPIHWAVMTRQIDMINELLGRGADINAERFDGARPVQLTSGDYYYRGWRDVPKENVPTPREILAHLRARGAYVDICTAAHIGDLERVRALLKQDPSLANRPSDYVTYYACSGTPLRNAAGAGHIEIVNLLLASGADPNLPEEGIAPRGYALYAAVCGGHMEIVKLLLEHGAHANVEIESSADTLSAAIARSDQPMIELLCAHGAARAVPLLAYAGDVQTAAAVFAANPALADDCHALLNAAGQGHEPFVHLMLRYRPDLASRIAVGVANAGPQDQIKTRALTEFLFQRGMNASLPNWLGITPLHRFAQRGDVENAALFLDKGADLNARDEELCSTPLGYAAKYGKTSMVELLLERGARPNLPDDPPWATPRAWAMRRGHEGIVKLLDDFGAR